MGREVFRNAASPPKSMCVSSRACELGWSTLLCRFFFTTRLVSVHLAPWLWWRLCHRSCVPTDKPFFFQGCPLHAFKSCATASLKAPPSMSATNLAFQSASSLPLASHFVLLCCGFRLHVLVFERILPPKPSHVQDATSLRSFSYLLSSNLHASNLGSPSVGPSVFLRKLITAVTATVLIVRCLVAGEARYCPERDEHSFVRLRCTHMQTH